ncbi:MAG: UDP-N-acetylmuramoyl-L-alanine--D-glutamate ligase [Rikenellaceae bacterium]
MKKIVILGGGESGYGSAVLAQAKGFEVFLSEGGMLKNEYKEKIEANNIPYEEGGHTLDKVLEASLIIKSPGVPDSANIVRAALSRGIRVISEIEFAARYTSARKICITGSNGKTTTTTLVYEIMRRAGMNVAVAGNIGQSFALSIARATQAYDWYVIELSSFQLDGLYEFKADISMLLNITPDHLDRYDYQMSKYVASKLRILQNQTPEDYFIYNADDAELLKILPATPFAATPLPFSLRGAVGGAWSDGESLYFEDNVMPLSEMALRGRHNVANALSAIMACSKAGVDFQSIRETLRDFAGVEHRLERVVEVDGVEYINDSKATNTDSVWYALDSMTRPTVWIAGGKDKGNDYECLKELARSKVKALICMGLDNEKLKAAFEGVVPVIYDTHSLAEALRAAREASQSGDAVLLSPACASFDLFENYEQRGRRFKDAVIEASKRL